MRERSVNSVRERGNEGKTLTTNIKAPTTSQADLVRM